MSVVTARYTFSGDGEDFGPRKGRRLVVLHTFENADPLKNTMRDAIAGATWQDRHDVLGSYNRIVAVDGVLGCVPDDRISGGMLAGGHPDYQPKAWLYDLLPANVVNDGNSYALQLCAMGRRAYYDEHGWPQEIIDGFAWSIIEEERATGIEMVVANHGDFQPSTRSDAGGALDLVMKRIPQLLALPDTAVEPEVNLPLIEKYEEWTTVVGGDFFTNAPGSGRKVFALAIPFQTTAESVDGTYRLGRINGEIIYVPRKSLKPRVQGGDPAYNAAVIAAIERRSPDADKAVAAAIAAFNLNLDTWIGQRPRA